jgi:hypothetical protein
MEAADHRLQDMTPQPQQVVALIQDECDRPRAREGVEDGSAVRVQQPKDRVGIATGDDQAPLAGTRGCVGRWSFVVGIRVQHDQ